MSEKEIEEVIKWAKKKKWALKFLWPAGTAKEVEGAILFGTVIHHLQMHYNTAKVEPHPDKPDWNWVTLFFDDPYEKVKEMHDTIAISKETGMRVIDEDKMMVVAEEL